MAWIEHTSADRETMTTALVSAMRTSLQHAIVARGRASMALAGGRTPLPVYRALAAAPLDWSKVVAMPGDERCVAHDHDACNVAALRRAFAAANGLRIESLTVADGCAETSLQHAQAVLQTYTESFDIVLLGIGEDAHTASLFPGAAELPAAMATDTQQDVFVLTPAPLPPEAPYPRITLGLARLLRARQVHLIATGLHKREVLHAAMAAYDPLTSPVSALLHAPGHTIHLHWSP